MSEFKLVPLGTHIKIQRGISWSSEQEVDSMAQYKMPVLRIPNIKEKLDLSDIIYLKPPSEHLRYKYAAKRGWSILVGSNGNPERIGNAVYINEDSEYLYASFLIGVAPERDSGVDSRLLAHVIRSPKSQQQLTESVQGSTGLKNLSQAAIRNIVFPLTSYPEQCRIADILDTLDRTVEATQLIIDKLQFVRQGLLHDLLTWGLDKQGHLRSTKTCRFAIKNEIKVPEDWQVLPLDSVLTLLTDYEANGSFEITKNAVRVSDSEDYAWYVRATDLENKRQTGRLKFIDEGGYRFLSKTKLFGGEVLLAKRGEIGKVYQMPKVNRPASLAPNLYLLNVNSLITSDYLFNFFTSPYGQKSLINANASTTLGALYKDDVKAIKIPLPAIEEQRLINKRMADLDVLLQSENRQLAKLQTLKRGLMEDLLTGRVRVAGAGLGSENKYADAAVQPVEVELPPSGLPPMPPPLPIAPQHRAMYRAGAEASLEAMSEWTRQLWDAAQGQQVGLYSHAALDAVLPQLAAASSERAGVERIPELLAGAGVRFMLLPHPRGSKASGAAFYLDDGRTQPVVGLSLRYPLLDVFWFNLFHELGHIRLDHEPVLEEALDSDSHDPKSPDEQAADAFAREQLIPEAVWQPFLKGGQHDSNRIKRLARGLNRHPATVAGRLAFDTQDWRRFNTPELRPNIELELRALMTQLGAMRDP